MSEAIEHGITRYMLYSLRDKGVIEQVSRGIYRLVELPPINNPDLVTVSLRFPSAVICFILPSGPTDSRMKHTNPASWSI